MLKYGSFGPSIKYEITPQTPKSLFKKLHFYYYIFFDLYKNEWKEHKSWRQKYQDK